MSESDAVGELRRELETAKCTIVQLQQQLAAMEQLLRQERVAREQAEAAAQQAAHAAEVAARAAIEARRQHHHGPASASTDQELISMELMLQQERAARREAEHAAQQAANAAEVAARAALEATRHHPVPAPVAVEENGRGTRESGDFEMEDVSDPQQELCGHALDVDSTQEPTKSRRSSASKARGPSKKSAKALSNENKKKKMSLAEVRKAAQEETERRMKERAKVLSSKK